jgi:putative solute:sodium symporter small subunit
VTDSNEAAWWRRTRGMAATTLIFLALVAVAPFLLGGGPDQPTLFDLPLRYLLISLALPIALVVAIFIFAAQQNALDQRYDVSED